MSTLKGTMGITALVGSLIFGIGCSSSGGKPAGWSGGEVAPGSADYGQVAAYNGVVYAAFSDQSTLGNSKLTVMKNDGSGWKTVGSAGFSSGSVNSSDISICVDSKDGTPYVAFDDSGADLKVMKFDGKNWVNVGTLNSITTSGKVLLAVSNGAVYVAYLYSDTLTVIYFNGSTWATITPAGYSTTDRIAFTIYKDVPYIAFNDNTANVVRLMKYSNSSWSEVATTTVMMMSDRDDWAPTLTGDNDVLYLISRNNSLDSYDTNTYKYIASYGAVVMKTNGTTTLESVGTLGSISNGDDVEFISGVVYKGVLYVAFDDEAKDDVTPQDAATVKYFNNGAWVPFGDYPDPCDIEDTILSADPSNGTLYFSYNDCNGTMTVKVH